MSRHTNTYPLRYKLISNLVFPWGVSVGSDAESSDSDTPVLQHPDGRILVPGTSIAGVIRGILSKVLDKEIFEKAFGTAENDKGIPSRIKVYDLVMDCMHFVRDGVGIDRETGAARDKVKFDREYSALACSGELVIEIDSNDESKENDLGILRSIQVLLRSGILKFGGGRDAGLAVATDLDLIEFDLRKLEDLLSYVKGDRGKFIDMDSIPDNLKSTEGTRWLNLLIQFNADSPLLSNSDRVLEGHELLDDEEKPSDHTPLRLKAMNGDSFYVIPGTSIRGVFRQQLETILRHSNGDDPCNIIISNCDAKNYCPACSIFGNPKRASRISFGPATMQAPKDPAEHEKLVDMVAINRFSGGAMEQAKFNARVITDGKFSFDIVMRDVKDDDLKLLFFLLRDFSDGFIPLGFGTRKGWGDVSDVKVSGKLIKLSNEGFSEIDLGSLDDLKAIIPQYSEAEAGS